jgi:hypothetical protein
MEGKFINFRVDVNNIFNHPTPSGTAPFTYDQRTYAAGSPVSNLNNTPSPSGISATRWDTESSLRSFE